MRMRPKPARGPRSLRDRVGIATMLVFLAVVPVTDGAGKASIAVRSVGWVPASIATGQRITLKGTVRNGSDSARVGRVVVWLRKAPRSASGRVVGRRVLRRLRANRSAPFKVSLVIPRTLAPGRYIVVACVRSGRQSPHCRRAKRRLTVVAATPAAGGLKPVGPMPLQTPAPDPPLGTAFQTIDGFGSSERGFADPHVFDAAGPAPTVSAAEQDAVLDALYLDLGLTRVRPAQPDTGAGPPPAGVEPVNDNADPLSTDLAAFTFGGKAVDDHAAYVMRAKARGVGVAWTSPLTRDAWIGAAAGTQDVAEYAEWLLAQVRRFAERGARLDYISIANEPSWVGNTMSGAFIRDVIKSLGPRLEAEGLLVPFVVCDDIRASASAAKAEIVLTDPAARRYVGALATHLYDEPLGQMTAMASLARQYDLPLWMSEFSLRGMSSILPPGSTPPTAFDWALLMHELLGTYSVSAIDYLWGFFGAGEGDATALVALQGDGSTYRGFARTKVYYYFGQYSRFIRPGAVRVEVSSSHAGVKATAYHGADNTRTIVAANPGQTSAVTILTTPDLAGVGTLSQIRTGPAENWAAARSLSVVGTSVSVNLPPRSVTTLTGTRG